MKASITFISVAFILVASFLCAEELRVFSNEEITATWVNPEYSGFEYNLQKFVLTHWGYYEAYIKIDSSSPKYKGTYHIMDKWTDSEGNTWYKSITRYEGSMTHTYEFGQISKDRSTWEYAYSRLDFPDEADLNPDNANYRIYYRQE